MPDSRGPGRTPTTAQALICAAAVGAVVALQGKANGELSSAGAGLVITSWLSYAGTVASVVLVIAFTGRARGTRAALRRDGRWWWYAVGLCGIPIVLAMAGGIPLVGVAIASVCSVAGQTVTGLGFDARGIGLAAPMRLTRERMLAGVIALVGLAIAIGGGGAKVSESPWVVAATCAMLFIAGAILCIQQAGNGRVTAIAGDPLVPGFTSTTGGLIGITVILGVVAIFGGLSGVTFPGIGQWYLYMGGPLGAFITVASAWVVRHLGTFALTLAVVGGQMVAAIVLDVAGPVGLAWQTAAAAAAVSGAVVLAIPRRARR